VFLLKVKSIEFEENPISLTSQQQHLKETLVEFLTLAKSLLAKCREAMRLDVGPPGSNVDDEPVANLRQSNFVQRATILIPSSQPDNSQNTIWQTEMEKGYETLIDAILPYISDIPGTDKLKKK
jgi:hypothetical protein